MMPPARWTGREMGPFRRDRTLRNNMADKWGVEGRESRVLQCNTRSPSTSPWRRPKLAAILALRALCLRARPSPSTRGLG